MGSVIPEDELPILEALSLQTGEALRQESRPVVTHHDDRDCRSHIPGLCTLGTHDEVRRSAGRDQLVVRMGLGIGSAVCQPTLGF